MRTKRGAIALYVIVACLFIFIVGVMTYIGTSGRQFTQLAALNKINGQYNNGETTTDDLYKQNDGGDIIPIYTPEQFAKAGSGEEVLVEQTGKTYVFSTDKTYMFYGIPEDLDYYMGQLTDEIKQQIKVEIGVGTIEGGVKSGILSLTKSTNALTTSLTITAIAKTEDGIQTFIPPTGAEKLYATGTTEIEETYEITQNGIYTFSVVDQKGKVTDAEIQITNIVVDGIGMVLSTTNWTKDDVMLTVTWPTASEKGRKEVKIGNGEWTRYIGASTVLTISENATIQARVTDGTESANVKKTNEITVGNIDKAEPILTLATEGTLTITEGDSHDVPSLFQYNQNGIAPITVQYMEDGYPISNTNELEPSTTEYEIICTVTKANGYQKNIVKKVKVDYLAGGDATEIATQPTRYYSRTVSNYECDSDGVSEWQIFNSDGENIYLIAKNYVSDATYIPAGRNGALIYEYYDQKFFNNIIGDYDGCSNILDESITDSRVRKWVPWEVNHPNNTTNAAKAIAYMLDNNVWSIYKDDRFADYAIGGPTVPMIVDVFNQRRSLINHQEITIQMDDTYGYDIIGDNESYWNASFSDPLIFIYDYDNYSHEYWITGFMGAGDMAYFYGNYYVYAGKLQPADVVRGTDMYSSYYGGRSFRPVVCLDSSVTLESNGDGTYLIKAGN